MCSHILLMHHLITILLAIGNKIGVDDKITIGISQDPGREVYHPVPKRDCLDCICDVESDCNPNIGCIMDEGSLSCGPYQIKLLYYLDCGTPGKQGGQSDEEAWKNCANDRNCARTWIMNYYNRYRGSCAGSGQSECEVLSRNHNGGPNGCRNPGKTEDYWNKIKQRGCQ